MKDKTDQILDGINKGTYRQQDAGALVKGAEMAADALEDIEPLTGIELEETKEQTLAAVAAEWEAREREKQAERGRGGDRTPG